MIRLLIPMVIFVLNVAPYANSGQTGADGTVDEANKPKISFLRPSTWFGASPKSIEKRVLQPFNAPSESKLHGSGKSIHFWLSLVASIQSTPNKPMKTSFLCHGYKEKVDYSENLTQHDCINKDTTTFVCLSSGKTKQYANTYFFPIRLMESTEADQEGSDADNQELSDVDDQEPSDMDAPSPFTDVKILRQQCTSCFDHENKGKDTLELPDRNGRLTLSDAFLEMLKTPEDLLFHHSENLLSKKNIFKPIDRIEISGNVTVKYKQLPEGEPCSVNALGFICDTDQVKVKMTGKHVLEIKCSNTISGEPVAVTIATNKIKSFISSGRATAEIELHKENKKDLFLHAAGNSSMTVSGPAGKTSITKETPKDIGLHRMTTKELICDYRHAQGDIFVNPNIMRKPNKLSVMHDKENPRHVILKSADIDASKNDRTKDPH